MYYGLNELLDFALFCLTNTSDIIYFAVEVEKHILGLTVWGLEYTIFRQKIQFIT